MTWKTSWPLWLVFLTGCSNFSAPDRADGDRTPLSAACETLDGLRCVLPWPSNTFTRLDPKSATGLRLSVDLASLGEAVAASGDDAGALNRADGFSRITPLVAGFSPPLDAASLGQAGDAASWPVRLIQAQAGTAGYGTVLPIPATSTDDPSLPGGASLLIGHPHRPLLPATDYVAVVMDSPRDAGGRPYPVPRGVRVALGLDAAASADEARLAGYHAPTRRVLARAGIDAAHVLRVWSFTTRSAADATTRLPHMIAAMRQAVEQKQVTVVIDSVRAATPPLLATVLGHLEGVPNFVSPAGVLEPDAAGLPKVHGTTEAPFRVTLPAGGGDYRVIFFGHGTGGNIDDDTFDVQTAQQGVAKVSFRFDGWTDADFIPTLAGLQTLFRGADHFLALTLQSLARGAAVQAALPGVLGDALSGAMLGPTPNPAMGRRPRLDRQAYAGGSLGGTLGLVIAANLPDIDYAVLNVPGAGWSHFVPGSVIWNVPDALLASIYGSLLDSRLALSMTQTLWDEMDGAAYGDRPPKYSLVQESIGDPVLPNIGSEILAGVVGARQLGAVLQPIPGIESATGPVRGSAITQYRVPATFSQFQIHGFVTCKNAASEAAQAQILGFLQTAWAGDPQISLPPGCTDGSCDFSQRVKRCD
jgi:hypothetical protein